MKTVCAWDNWYCLVNKWWDGLGPMVEAGLIILFAIGFAAVVATLWE